jgi:endonuclease/exonuclease/phosphatase family metal-dependent hydrolase
MKILSCNIRTSLARDGENAWPHRKALCARLIRAQEADLIGFQEMSDIQHADLAAALPEYDHYGLADEPCGHRPQNAIFFLKGRFRRVTAGGYWLSKTPHVPGSRSWDSACVRLANWVRLQDLATGKEFRFVNTHLDHVSQPAREGQAALLVEEALAYPAEYPQLLAGDLNAESPNRAINVLREGGWADTFAAANGDRAPGSTFHAFKGPESASPIGKIDWIFMRGCMAATESAVIRDSENGRFPSDHYFLSATVRIL